MVWSRKATTMHAISGMPLKLSRHIHNENVHKVSRGEVAHLTETESYFLDTALMQSASSLIHTSEATNFLELTLTS